MVRRFRGDTVPMVWQLSINGEPHDLSTVARVTFTYIKSDETVVYIDGSIIDAANGTVRFDVAESDFDTPGGYKFDLQVDYVDGTKRTFEKDIIKIDDDVNKL